MHCHTNETGSHQCCMTNFPFSCAGDWQVKQLQNFRVVGAKKDSSYWGADYSNEKNPGWPARRFTPFQKSCDDWEMAKAGPQTIRTSLRKSFSHFGHRRNWVSAKSTEDKGKIYEPRSTSQDVIMQAPSTKDLPNSHRLVSIKYMSLIAETMESTAVILCNQTSGNKKSAEIMRMRIPLSNTKRGKFGKTCSPHRKRFLKNTVSLTPIHKDEQIIKKNSAEITSMFRWITAIQLTMPKFKQQYSARIYADPFKVVWW